MQVGACVVMAEAERSVDIQQYLMQLKQGYQCSYHFTCNLSFKKQLHAFKGYCTVSCGI